LLVSNENTGRVDKNTGKAYIGLMAIEYRRDERGARVFEYAGVTFRAFWLNLGHEWSIREIGPDGAPTGRKFTQRNWSTVESFMAWLAKFDGRVA
jgi:hypothetical protein